MMRMNERIQVFLHACEILTVNVYNRLMKVCINYVYYSKKNKIKSQIKKRILFRRNRVIDSSFRIFFYDL